MGFIDSLLLDWRVALSTVRPEDVRTTLTAVVVTTLAISLAISLIRKSRQSSFATILLESHVIGLLLEKKDGWLRSLLPQSDTAFDTNVSTSVQPTAVIHGLSPANRAIIVEPSLGQTILRRPQEVLDNDPMQWALQERVFGCRPALRPTVIPVIRSLFTAVSRNLLSEAAVKPVVRATNALLGEKLMDWLPSSTEVGPVPAAEIAKRPWLRDADPRVSSDGAITLDLYTAVRDFTMYISTHILAGEDLVKVYPEIIPDLFTLDAGFGPLGLGFPTWLPLGIIRRAVAARKRVITGLSAFAERLEAVGTGVADEALQTRMADTNPMFFERSAIYRSQKMGYDDRGAMDLGILWAMNANTSPAAFWLVAHLVTDADALAAVRAEVAPFVSVGGNEPASVDTDGLVYRSPRLKACFLEMMRLASEPSSIRHIGQDFSIAHPSSPSSGPLTFRRDAHLTVAHTVNQRDANAYPEPEAFRPQRFLVKVSEGDDGNVASGAEKATKGEKAVHSMLDTSSPVRAVYGTLKPWGDGPLMCKGRLFAEREMLVEVALLVTAWDFEPLQPNVPNHLPGTGVVKPDRAMRVKVRRRVVAS